MKRRKTRRGKYYISYTYFLENGHFGRSSATVDNLTLNPGQMRRIKAGFQDIVLKEFNLPCEIYIDCITQLRGRR